jgi:ribosomal-protein-alanine N-acetyltransferase
MEQPRLWFSSMTLADIAIVAELEQRSFPTPWPASTYQHELLHNRISFYWVIRSAATTGLPPILAYGGYWLTGDEGHIVTIASHPDWRRRQLGAWILLEMLAQIRSQQGTTVTLEAREGNHVAHALYRKMGFEEVGRQHHYYRDNNEDALLFTLSGLDTEAVWQQLANELAAVRRFTVQLV